MTTAILLIAHGSRRDQANADLVEVARMLRPRVHPSLVEVAYLELAEPTIPAGLQTCVNRGAQEIRMLPCFLFAGAHVSDDLAAFQRDFHERHPEIPCLLCPPLGLHPHLIDILVDRVRQGS